MGRGIKILLAAAGLLALLAVAGVVLVYVLVDPNDYKPEIVRLVKEQTGRDLVLEGDLGLSLFPGLSVTLGPARLGNAPGFGDRPFAVLKGASARLAIRPLIDGRVEVSHVRLDGLVLNLERDAQGRTNWDDLLAAGPGAPKAGADKAGAGAGQAGPEKGPGLALSVDAIRIKDASVSWTEAEGGQVYRVDGVDLAVTNFAAGRSFDFTMSLGFAAKDPAIDGRAEVQGSAVLDPERDAYLVKGLKAEVRAKGGDLPGGRAEVLLGAADLRLDLARQLASLEGLSLSAYGLSARGKAVVSGFRDRVSAKGALEIPSFEPRQVLASLGVEGLRTADPEALSRAAAAVDFKASFDEFEASSLLVRVDASTVQGQGRITNFKNPIYALKARVDYLDLDRYLPPQEQAEAGSGQSRSGQSRSGQSRSGSGVGSSGPQEREIIPVKLLRGLRLDADLSAAELKAFGLRMSDVVLRVHALDGRVDVKALNMDLYQGRVESSAGVDCRGQRPETKLEIKADKVEAGPLVRDATGKDSFAGTVRLSSSLEAVGAGFMDLRRTLNGTASFGVVNGVFPGVDLGDMAEKTAESRDRKGALTAERTDRTRFGEARGSAVIRNGVLTNRDFELSSPHLRAQGQGSVDLAGEQIDYMLRAKLVASSRGQGGGGLTDYVGVPVPVRVTGTLSEPRYAVSLAEYANILGQGAVDTVGGVVKGVGGVVGGAIRSFEDILGGGKSGSDSRR